MRRGRGPVPASSNHPPQGTAEPQSHRCGWENVSKNRQNITQAVRPEEKKNVRCNPVNMEVREERGEGSVPGAGADILLEPMERILVEQVDIS